MTDTIEVFLKKIAGELELPESRILNPDENFRQLEEWSSMNALIVLSYLNIEYGKNFTGADLSNCQTFRDIFNKVKGN